MKLKIAISLGVLSAAMLLNTGCKKWLDINENPNVAQDVPMNMLLSNAQVATASAIGCDLQINGSLWAQYWTQSPSASQYKVYEQYSPAASDYDREWGLLYSTALMDLETIQKKAWGSGAKDYSAVAKLMKAYVYQVISDAWGDVPFTEALKGLPADGGIISPKYDVQSLVYAGINDLIDSARLLIDELQTVNVEGDLIYNGDLGLWWKFANTLQLKVYLRMSEVAPAVAAAGVADVYAIAGDQFGFIQPGEDAMIHYGSSAGNQNPLHSEMVGLSSTQNLVASKTVVDSMNANNDYRAYALFSLTGAGIVGIPQGAYNVSASTVVSLPTEYTGAFAAGDNSALAPVRFISSYESLFLLAEAAARGWVTGEDDEALFYAALEDNFAGMDALMQEAGAAPGEGLYVYLNGDTANAIPPAYWGMYPLVPEAPLSLAQTKVRHIITQKWFSMCGTQGFEAWTEQRRTGYPDFFTISANSLIGNKFPVRFLYPDVELSANGKFPGQKFVDQKLWWDLN